jgi:hypothetical protein
MKDLGLGKRASDELEGKDQSNKVRFGVYQEYTWYSIGSISIYPWPAPHGPFI